MIIEFSNPLSINKIIKLAKEVKDTPIDKLRYFMLSSLNNPNAKIYVDSHNGEIKGFVFITVEQWQCEDTVFIHLCVIKPCAEDKYIGFEFLNKIKLFAKERNIRTVLMATQRNPKSWIKKYKFSIEGTILKLDLTK